MPTKTYEVLNPRGIPTDTHILRYGEQTWNEGDTFTKPVKMPLESVTRWVKDGFLLDPDAVPDVVDVASKEVTDG